MADERETKLQSFIWDTFGVTAEMFFGTRQWRKIRQHWSEHPIEQPA